jgi:hypothetical protein
MCARNIFFFFGVFSGTAVLVANTSGVITNNTRNYLCEVRRFLRASLVGKLLFVSNHISDSQALIISAKLPLFDPICS